MKHLDEDDDNCNDEDDAGMALAERQDVHNSGRTARRPQDVAWQSVITAENALANTALAVRRVDGIHIRRDFCEFATR